MQLIQGGWKQLLDVEARVKRKIFDYIFMQNNSGFQKYWEINGQYASPIILLPF